MSQDNNLPPKESPKNDVLPTPIDSQKISDVIITMDSIVNIYKKRKESTGKTNIPSLSALERKCREFLQLTDQQPKAEKKIESKLRADAPVFTPSFLKAEPSPPSPSPSPPGSSGGTALKSGHLAAHTSPTTVLQHIAGSGQALPPQVSPLNHPFTPQSSKSRGTTAKSNNASETKKTIIKADTPSTPSPGKDDWEEKLRKEVAEATELVWAQAEAWVDAELAAEEEEWRILEMGINDYVGLTPTSLNSAGLFDIGDMTSRDDPVVRDLLNSLNKRALSVTTAFDDPEIDIDIHSSLQYLLDDTSPRKSSSNRHSYPSAESKGATKRQENRPLSPFVFGSPSMRTLHSKLSSPDRRRSMTPTDALKQYEAKLSAAESNRDRNVAVKVQKAMRVSNRVKEHMLRAAEKQAQAEEALQDRLKNAEQRHVEHINGIREKAGNVNAKVTEVLCWNVANSEALALALQQKLEEVEARILAASQRREQRLAGITGSQKKKNTKRVQQMSEFRLQLERQKMERWEKLQQRLEHVRKRREDRFVELKRRAEAEARRLDVLAAAHSAEKSGKDSPFTPNRTSVGVGVTTACSSGPESSEKVSSPSSETTVLVSMENQVQEKLLTDSFPASPPRATKTQTQNSGTQLLSFSSLEHCFVQFHDQLSRAKVVTIGKEAWSACMEYFVATKASECIANNVQTMLNEGHTGINAMVLGCTTYKPSDLEERDASKSQVYASLLEDILQNGILQNAAVAEQVNFLVQSTMDDVKQHRWDRVQDTLQSGGALVLSVMLNRDNGALMNAELFSLFLAACKVDNSPNSISRYRIEYGMMTTLLRLLIQIPSHEIKTTILSILIAHGLHLVMANFIIYLLIFATNKHQKEEKVENARVVVSVQEDQSVALQSPLRIVESRQHVNVLLNDLVDILIALLITLIEGDQNSSTTGLLTSTMAYLFVTNSLPLLMQFGHIVVSDIQCKLVGTQDSSSPVAPLAGGAPTPTASSSKMSSIQVMDSMVLRMEEAQSALHAVTQLVHFYARFALHQKTSTLSGSSTGTSGVQAKHWLSLFRRNEVFALLSDCLGLVADDMAQIVLHPAKLSSRSMLGSTMTMPLIISDYILKLQALGKDVLVSLSAVIEAESDSFQHLSKEQQVKLITSLQVILCFYCTSMVSPKPFPILAGEAEAATPGLSREAAVADICAIVAAVGRQSIEARQLIGTVNSSARGASNNPLTSPGSCSLLLTLASLPVRLMKEKRVKNILMPCLIVACMEIEGNVQIVRRCGKASYVRKYLEVAISDHLEGTRDIMSAEEIRAKKERLQPLLALLSPELWEVALLAWSGGDLVKSAKI
eukprot:scaffold681_cov173-Ochromonas_danica.AAC.11